MYGHAKIFNFVTTCFCVLYRTQVNAFYYEALDPINGNLEEWHQRDPRVAPRNEEQNIACERPNIYICEEPPDVIPSEATKTCNYRSVRYHQQVYKWVAGRGCLLYTPDFLYTAGYNTFNLNGACLYGGLFAPCLEIAKEDGQCGCYPFDPAFEGVANAVREAIIPAAHGRWERCFYAANECCSHHMNTTSDENNYCEATFDGWTCWDNAEAGSVASEVCSEFAYSNSGPSCHHYSTKQCYHNGTWELQTDYSTCSITLRLLRRYRFHIAVLSFSIISCIPAIFIFYFYKRLRITRVALHRNLLIFIVLRSILVIISRSTIYVDELTNTGDTIMSNHGIACRFLAIAERIASNAVFVAMLIEGIYLHRTIVAVFKQQLNAKWLYGIGIVITILPVAIWASIMGILNDHSCWLIYTMDHIQWVLDAPRITILLVNTGLFIDVLRVLLTKIRNSENSNQLSTTKATLFLMPIFGTQFLLTALRPSTTDCTWEQIYYYISYTIEGLQGFIVALSYCYINKEVHMLIKGTYKKTENAVVSRIRRDSSYRNNSTVQSGRKITCSTVLPSQQQQKENYSTITPKLHVAEIISIQATERLAEILEPVYETIQNGILNEGYDSLVRSESDSNGLPTRRPSKEDYYAFTNASSISIECQDWIRCVSSPSSSVYNNSLNEYETRYLEKKFPNHPKLRELQGAREKKLPNETNVDFAIENARANLQPSVYNTIEIVPEQGPSEESEIESEMLDEIMQYIESSEVSPVPLASELLSPNRINEDKIVFVDD